MKSKSLAIQNIWVGMAGLVIAMSATLLAITSVSAAKPSAAEGAKPGGMSIVDIVTNDDSEFDVLQAAVIKADLVNALNSNKQLTVFAPTDQAFVDHFGLDEETLITAIENGVLSNDELTNILLFHVTNGRRVSASVVGAPGYNMLNGDRLSRSQLISAGIEATDISANNGVIHVISSVLIPN